MSNEVMLSVSMAISASDSISMSVFVFDGCVGFRRRGVSLVSRKFERTFDEFVDCWRRRNSREIFGGVVDGVLLAMECSVVYDGKSITRETSEEGNA